MKNLIKKYLNETKINFRILDDNNQQTIFVYGVNLKNGTCDIIIDIRTEQEQVLTSIYFPIKIPLEHHRRVSELIIRINDNLNLGKFNLYLKKGDLYFKTAYLFNEEPLNYLKIFDLHLQFSYYFMDRYIPAFMSIIYGNTKPLDAFNKIENVINPELN